MKFNLKDMKRRELEKLRGDVDKALDKLAQAEKKLALDAAKKAAKAHGFSLEELTGAKPASAARESAPARAPKAKGDGRAKVAPKFRNPENPEQTWTGRGRAPKWVEAHIAQGGSKEDLAI
ncbi:H-NS histone family protein [Sinisalibacter lacisalsi]|uniref:Histone-like nucleoid-structuring protein H-NS n=1 Tax=Sinisalibacter lacisalsi TaxID=1526570 RepID=A0ABQ1QTX7_9RHOB|nr:H-NS histone family protein [Sinisalibacter lacisalsi]GGD46106.1 histone-like nucleoid-structuring protein H-NS [Sinisalibacter lacisalsi]